MKHILLIGSGAREHAIFRAIKRSVIETTVTCLATHENPALKKGCEKLMVIDINDVGSVIKAIDGLSIDHAIIGPEAPLDAGLSDALKLKGIDVFGPNQALARIETSKSYCRQLMRRVLPSALPQFYQFSELNGVKHSLIQFDLSCVIKATGLMGGKGVYVSDDHFTSLEEALGICDSLFKKGHQVLIEEKLFGEEFSLISFCDGESLKHMPVVQDNKRAYEDDKGPNTGGMGSISFADHRLPFLPESAINEAKAINESAIKALKADNHADYKGVLYGGFMYTPDGVKLIEYNARFGDPEAINLLSLLESDFVEILNAVAEGKLSDMDIRFSSKATVCKYVVPEGYPGEPVKGSGIHIDIDDDKLYCGHLSDSDNGQVMLGSRAVACLGVGASIESAEREAESKASQINGDVFYRRDIGTNALIDKRSKNMQVLCENQ